MASFTFDGKEIPLEAGDTYASALHRAGVRVISRSLRYHRPRGLFCNVGSCASCFVGVDGVPNVPACMATARPGSCVESQNRIGTAKHDLLGVVDKVYWRGFDPHDAWTRSKLLNSVFLRGVRFMSGLGKPPAADVQPTATTHRAIHVDELIIGAGRSGLLRAKAASAALAAGPSSTSSARRVLVVDELPRLGGSAHWDVDEAPTRQLAGEAPSLPGVECWTEAVCFGLYPRAEAPKVEPTSHAASPTAPPVAAAASAPLVFAAIRRATAEGEEIVEVHAARITIATGAHDGVPSFTNNDLPGILTARGAMRLLREHKVAPGTAIVVHGDPLPASAATALREAGCAIVATGIVEEARGSSCVTGARLRGSWVACDTIVCNLPGLPRIELFQQAGCALAWTGGVLRPVAEDGATDVPGVYAALVGLPRQEALA